MLGSSIARRKELLPERTYVMAVREIWQPSCSCELANRRQEGQLKLEKMETACSPTSTDPGAEYATNVAAVELPKDAATALKRNFGDLSKYTPKILAVEDYRAGGLTPEQLHRLLSLSTRP